MERGWTKRQNCSYLAVKVKRERTCNNNDKSHTHSNRHSRLAQRRLSNCHDVGVKPCSAYLPPLRYDEILQTLSTRARRVLGPRRRSRALVARDRRRSRHTIAARRCARRIARNTVTRDVTIFYLLHTGLFVAAHVVVVVSKQ